MVPEGKVDPFLVHLHRPRLRVDDHLGEGLRPPVLNELFQTSLLLVNLPSSAAILSISLYASGSQGGGWKEGVEIFENQPIVRTYWKRTRTQYQFNLNGSPGYRPYKRVHRKRTFDNILCAIKRR